MFGFCLFWTWVAMETKTFLCLIRLQNTPRTNWLIHFPPSSCSLLVKCTTGTRVVPVTFPWTARRIIKRDRQIIPSTRTRMGRRRQEIKTIITRDKEIERWMSRRSFAHTKFDVFGKTARIGSKAGESCNVRIWRDFWSSDAGNGVRSVGMRRVALLQERGSKE